MAAVRQLEFKNNIWLRDCHRVHNFTLVYQISAKLVHTFGFQSPVTAKCLRRLLGNDCYHDNRIMADMSGTWWNATTQVSSQSSYGISNIFQHGGRPPSWILKILIILTFGQETVIEVRTSWRTCRWHDGMRPPKFHPNPSIVRRVTAFPTFSNMAAVRHFEFQKI